MAKQLTVQRKKIRIGDISMSYLLKDSVNKTKTIIFIHGFPFNKNMWNDQLEALPKNIRGIAIDIRGHGGSTSGHGYFSMDVFAKDLLAFIKTLSLGEVVLCGISMGGYIALRAQELAPAVCSGLVLADTNAEADSNEAKIKRFDTIQSVLKYGKRTFAIGFVKKVFAEESLHKRPEAVSLIQSSIRRNDVRSICATLLALASRTDTRASLREINCKCLIVRGAEDALMSEEQALTLKTGIRDAELLTMPHCGHLPNLEDPQKFNAALLRYLEELS